jgi:EmrB/QacA subfamily drug resistance transporter
LLPEFPPQRRAAAVGLWAAGAAVAATCGPVFGGLLVAASWRWVFLVNIPLGAVTAVGAVLILRESREAERGRWPDLVGAVILCVAIGALTLGVVKGSEWGWTSARVVVAEAVAVAGLVVFTRRASRHPSPVVELALLRVPSTRAANAAALLFSMGFFPLLLATVLFLTGVWHYSVVQAGAAFAPGPLMVALCSWPAGMLVPRVGPRVLVVSGVALFAAANVWWAAQATASPEYVTGMLPQILVSGIGVALVFPVLAGAAVSALPPDRAATGSAVFNMARQIGGVVGVAILIAILGPSTPTLAAFREGWLMMAAAALAAGAVAVTLRSRDRVVRHVAGATSAAAPERPPVDEACDSVTHALP